MVADAMQEQVFSNANVVTAAAVVDGHVAVRGGEIAAVESSKSAAGSIDCDGDYLLPGLVELHTDHLESHCSPRPGVRWPIRSAMLAHDAQIAVAGITTVFDALALGDFNPQSLMRWHR
jgi:alpha-D-ribose 1-methylphosphonate 5-triphosphate diphosphatase